MPKERHALSRHFALGAETMSCKFRAVRSLLIGFSSAVTLIGGLAIPSELLAGEPSLELSLEGVGQRDYYCTALFALTSLDVPPVQDVNGYFEVYVNGERFGRSSGASFRFDEGETITSAVFETPNAPCEKIDGYVFVVGACIQGTTFIDRTACAASIRLVSPAIEINAR